MNLLLVALLTLASAPALQESAPEPTGSPRVAAPRAEAICGVLVFEHDGGPVASYPVRLFGGGIEPLARTTDEAGRFEFPRVPIEGGALWVSAPNTPGLRVTRNSRRVPADGSELRFVVRRVVERPFVGVALRKGTGQPLRHTRLKVTELNGESDECRTDANGAFETRMKFAGPKFLVTILDNADPDIRPSAQTVLAQWAPGAQGAQGAQGAPATVQLDVGPRLELDFTPGLDMDWKDYRVEVRPADAGPGWHVQRQQAVLHAGTPAWVRLPNDVASLAGMDLRIFSEGDPRTWFARIPARITGPLRPELVPTGSLTVRFTSGGEPTLATSWKPPDSLMVGLAFERLDGPSGSSERFETPAPLQGEYPLQRIGAGLWRIRTKTALFVDAEAKVRIPEHGVAELHLELGPRLETGTVRIRLVDEAGDIPDWDGIFDAPDYGAGLSGGELSWGYSIVTAATCGNGISAYFGRRQFEGRWVLEAKLDGIPLGEFVASASSSTRMIAPAFQPVRVGETATFVIQAPRDTDVYGFRVSTADGSRAPYYRVYGLSDAVASPFRATPLPNGVHAYDVPEQGALPWTLTATGHQRVFGDRTTFVGRDGGHWADVVLEPGFRVRLRATFADDTPAPGVAVDFAGERFVTDERGLSDLATPLTRPPLFLEIRSHDIVGGDTDADGVFSAYRHEVRVVVATR